MQLAVAPHRQIVFGAIDLCAGFAQFVQDRSEMIGSRTVNGNFAIGGGGGDGERRCFDAVRNHFVLGAVQLLDAGDGDGRTARAGNLCPHFGEKCRQIDHLRLAGCAFNGGHAVG